MTVKNITNRNGNKVANQFSISNYPEITFQSYDSTIATIDYANHNIRIFSDWDYSNTTLKYFKQFLSDNNIVDGMTKKELQKAFDERSLNGWTVEVLS